jgi:hypothetical protein
MILLILMICPMHASNSNSDIACVPDPSEQCHQSGGNQQCHAKFNAVCLNGKCACLQNQCLTIVAGGQKKCVDVVKTLSTELDPTPSPTADHVRKSNPVVKIEEKIHKSGSFGERVSAVVLLVLGFVIVATIALRYRQRKQLYYEACEASKRATSDLAMLTPAGRVKLSAKFVMQH